MCLGLASGQQEFFKEVTDDISQEMNRFGNYEKVLMHDLENALFEKEI
jgi:hypothetical protein